MESLGRLINLCQTADNVYVNLRHAGAVTFICYLAAGDTFTVTEANTLAGGGAAALAKVTQFYTAAPTGTGTWTKTTQAAVSTVVTTTDVVAVFTVRGEQLSDGFGYVRCASTSTGTVLALLHDLRVRRTPENLPAVSA